MRKLLFLGLLVLLAATARASMDPASWINSDPLLKAIQKEGPRTVARELYSSKDGWSYVLTNIRTGDLQWFAVADRLRPGLSGVALRDWSEAMSRAMETIPRHVLASADKKSLPIICSPEGDETPAGSPEVTARHVNHLLRVVRGVHDARLEKKRITCLQNLTEARAELETLIRQDL